MNWLGRRQTAWAHSPKRQSCEAALECLTRCHTCLTMVTAGSAACLPKWACLMTPAAAGLASWAAVPGKQPEPQAKGSPASSLSLTSASAFRHTAPRGLVTLFNPWRQWTLDCEHMICRVESQLQLAWQLAYDILSCFNTAQLLDTACMCRTRQSGIGQQGGRAQVQVCFSGLCYNNLIKHRRWDHVDSVLGMTQH